MEGLTDEQIAKKIGINPATLYTWMNKHDEIRKAIKKGKAPVDVAVEKALLNSALGYYITIKEPIKVRTEKSFKGGKIVEEHVEYVSKECYIPPSNLAQIYWLKNRRPDKWRDKPAAVEDNSTMEKLDKMLAEVRSHAFNS